jgi:hypothetical protein
MLLWEQVNCNRAFTHPVDECNRDVTTATSLVVQSHAEAGHNEHRSCGFKDASSTADNEHCCLVDSGTDKLCGLYSQGAVALDQRLPDEHEALVPSVSTCIGNLALGVVSGGNFQLAASSLND